MDPDCTAHVRMCVCEWVCVCVCAREPMCVCVCVCVCVWARAHEPASLCCNGYSSPPKKKKKIERKRCPVSTIHSRWWRVHLVTKSQRRGFRRESLVSLTETTVHCDHIRIFFFSDKIARKIIRRKWNKYEEKKHSGALKICRFTQKFEWHDVNLCVAPVVIVVVIVVLYPAYCTPAVGSCGRRN